MYVSWFEHENWIHLAGKNFSSPPRATEKLVLLNCKQTGSAMNRSAVLLIAVLPILYFADDAIRKLDLITDS
jgi:hypothetical protein